MRVRGSIRSQLLRLTVAVAVVFFGLLALSTYQEVQQERKQAQESALALAQLTAAHTERLLADAEQTLAQIAQRPLVQAMDPAHCDPELAELFPLFSQFVDIGVVTAEGAVICSQLTPPGVGSLSVADREWFMRVKQSQTFTVSKVEVGRVSGRWVAVLAYPVHNEAGDFVGAVTMPMDLERYQANFRDLTLPANATITIIDSDGTVVARSLEPERWVGEETRGVGITNQVLAERKGFTVAPGADGIDKVYGFTTIGSADWYVYSGIPTAIAFASVRTVILRDTVTALAFTLLAAALLAYLQRQVARPVANLATVSQAVAQGQLHQRVPVEGSREMAEVIQQFNQMLDVRAHRTGQLQQVAQTSLALHPVMTPEEILRVAIGQAREILQAELCLASLVALTEGEEPLVVTALSARYESWQEQAGRLAEHVLCRLVAESDRPLCWNQAELEAHPEWPGLQALSDGRPPIRGWLIAPLYLSTGSYLGFMLLSAKEEGEWATTDEALLWQLAQTTATAIENALLFRSLSEQREQMRGLALRLAQAEEGERRRLARELHDGVGQLLTALNIDIYLLREAFPADSDTYSRLTEAQAVVQEAMNRTRDVLVELRPTTLEEQGLGAAVRWYAEHFSQRTRLAIEVDGEEADERLSPDVELALFRIMQESLTNIAKHAEADQVTIQMQHQDGHFHLMIADNGKGFDLAALQQARRQGEARPSWGLINMRERAEAVKGHLEIEARPGAGTKVIVQVPLSAEGH